MGELALYISEKWGKQSENTRMHVCVNVCLYKYMCMSVYMYMYGMHLYMCKYEYVCACMHIFLIQYVAKILNFKGFVRSL